MQLYTFKKLKSSIKGEIKAASWSSLVIDIKFDNSDLMLQYIRKNLILKILFF